jgi:Tfp pilus assembly protein PilX
MEPQAAARIRRRRGQALVLVTAAMFVMLGMLALVVDLGWAHYRREAAQAAADAAALAAAQAAMQTSGGGSVSCGSQIACQSTPQACPSSPSVPPTNNLVSGCLYAAANGFRQAGRQSVRLASGITSPPPTAPGVNARYWVTAYVSENTPRFFSGLLGRGATVAARATAIIPPATGGGCIYVLRPTGTAVTNNGNAYLESGCGVYVNSSSSTAVLLNGNAYIVATGSGAVNIVGNWLGNGNAYIKPAPNLGVQPATDPFASMQPPSVGACTSSGVTLNGQQSATINPGVYCGPIILNGQTQLTMNPGLYVLKNGITVNGGSQLTAVGVTIYNQGGSITINGSSGATLSAPESGPWQGIAIFQARNNSNQGVLNGGAALRVTGALYFPNASLTFNGNGNSDGASTTLVAWSLTLNGNAYIRNPATTPYSGGTIARVSLTE